MTLLTRAAGWNRLGRRGLTPSLSELQLAVSTSFVATTLSLLGFVSSGSVDGPTVTFAVKGALKEDRRLRQSKAKAISRVASPIVFLLEWRMLI